MKRTAIAALSLGLLLLVVGVSAYAGPARTPSRLNNAHQHVGNGRHSASSRLPSSAATTIIVTSTADSGTGTLRQALLDARSGDTITFDPVVFPPTAPVTITLTSGLPEITQGNLTIDASNAGVILDGSNIGTTPETLLSDDVSLTLDGGPNLIANGDFSAGLGHWRPWDEGPGATRSLNSGDFHSSPHSYAWSSTAQVGEGYTVYDTADTSDPLGYCFSSENPFYPGSTVWITTTGNITAELRFWYRYGPAAARLQALFSDGHVEQISDWWFERVADWTEAVARQTLPAHARNIALELLYGHSESRTSGFSITSNGNTIRGLQITRFPMAGAALFSGAQNNTIGGDRGIGAGPLGQGNLISGNGSFGLGLWDAGTSFNTIQGNHIGTDLSGTRAWGSRRDGINIGGASYNLVVDNLISGHGNGVYLCCAGDGHNTVRGNYIGTDPSGVDGIGNRFSGIAVDRTGHNVVGPDNVIAHNAGDGISIYGTGSLRNTITQNSIHDNRGHGVSVFGSDSLSNTITQNSIHDNVGMGIDLGDGGNTELTTPLIFDFDLGAGTVTGWACANCAVEIFSDNSDEGQVYEGRATADGTGWFAFDKGAPLTGPRLTATASDSGGDTSEFSVPTQGASKSTTIQDGNHLPKTRIQTKRSRELADNRIAGWLGGGWSPEPWVVDGIVNLVTGLGLKRVRFSINEPDAEQVNWSKPEFSIHPGHDDLVTRLADNDVIITYFLTFWDKATWPGGQGANCPRFKTEDEIQHYLDYVRFIVRHFKDRIPYFEIWNEPDVQICPQWIEVADYINLVKRAVPVIRQEYPEAKIQVGGVAYLKYSYDYLFSILRSDIMPLVDVVAWHPMYGTSPEFDPEYYYEYPAIVQEIKDVASAHGFQGDYEADELLWYTIEEAHWDGWSHRYSNTIAAKYHARGIVMHLGMDVTVGNAGVPAGETSRAAIQSAIGSLCTIMAGAEAISLPVEIESEATNIRSYSFSLPNDDKLVALWTDGVAVEDDPGITTTIILPGLLDQRVMGIDVLHSFEQKLITSSEDDSLVIRNLMVKDYPIILRLAPIRYVFLPIVLKGYAR